MEELEAHWGLETHINYPCTLTGFLIEDSSREGRQLCNSPAPKLGQLLPYELWGLTPFPGQWEGELGILNCSSYKRPQPAPLTLGHSNLRVRGLAASLTTGLEPGSSQRRAPSPRTSPRTSPRRTKAQWATRLTALLVRPLFWKCVHERTMLRFHQVFKGGKKQEL